MPRSTISPQVQDSSQCPADPFDVEEDVCWYWPKASGFPGVLPKERRVMTTKLHDRSLWSCATRPQASGFNLPEWRRPCNRGGLKRCDETGRASKRGLSGQRAGTRSRNLARRPVVQAMAASAATTSLGISRALRLQSFRQQILETPNQPWAIYKIARDWPARAPRSA
jgi:hypothetical protein